MKKHLITLFSLLVLFSFFMFTGCKNYDEGPGITLRSKQNRLVNEWKLSAMLYEGLEIGTPNRTFQVNKDGTFRLTTSGVIQNGKWLFSKSKSSLFMEMNDTDVYYTYYILKLRSNELWIINGEGYEYRYISN